MATQARSYTMTDTEKLAKILDLVEKHAAHQTCHERNEDWYPGEGGDFDDTYYNGTGDGVIFMAREILAVIRNLQGD
jgi:hypothetical protein